MYRVKQADRAEARAVARWYELRSDPKVRGSESRQLLADTQLRIALEEQLGMSAFDAQAYVQNLLEAYRQTDWI